VDKQTVSKLVSGEVKNGVNELRHANAPSLTFTKDIRSGASCSVISSTIDNKSQVHNTSEKENNVDMGSQFQRKRMREEKQLVEDSTN